MLGQMINECTERSTLKHQISVRNASISCSYMHVLENLMTLKVHLHWLKNDIWGFIQHMVLKALGTFEGKLNIIWKLCKCNLSFSLR